MSDRMGVTEAQAYLDTWSTGDSVDMWKTRAARAVVAQAEQIERLQRAVNYAIKYSLQDAVDLVVDGVLHPEDMEAPA